MKNRLSYYQLAVLLLLGFSFPILLSHLFSSDKNEAKEINESKISNFQLAKIENVNSVIDFDKINNKISKNESIINETKELLINYTFIGQALKKSSSLDKDRVLESFESLRNGKDQIRSRARLRDNNKD